MPGCAVPDEHAIDARIQRRAAVRCAVDLIGAVVLLVAGGARDVVERPGRDPARQPALVVRHPSVTRGGIA